MRLHNNYVNGMEFCAFSIYLFYYFLYGADNVLKMQSTRKFDNYIKFN